jgi:hypothetical protein
MKPDMMKTIAALLLILAVPLAASAGYEATGPVTRVEGFAKLISAAGHQDFVTPRGPRMPGAYAQTHDGEPDVTWMTAPVPAHDAPRIVFAWEAVMSGLYHQSGAFMGKAVPFPFELYLNGNKIVDFHAALPGDTRFTGQDATGPAPELFFDYIGPDWIGNLNGIMYLTVPAALVPAGKPAELRIVGRPAPRDAFCAVITRTGVWPYAGATPDNPDHFAVSPELRERLKQAATGTNTSAEARDESGTPDRIRAGETRPRAGDLVVDPERTLHVLILSGLTGNAEEQALIEEQSNTAYRLFRNRLGYPESHVRVLADRNTDAEGTTGEADRESIRRMFAQLTDELTEAETLLLIIAGNANIVGDRVMFNVRGKDPLVDDFAQMTVDLKCRLVICALTPVSGAFIEKLGRPGRIVIAACNAEYPYRTAFGLPFLQALSSPDADIDGSGRVSLLEAFRVATADVADQFEQKGFIQNEQALLDDDGDGKGQPFPKGFGGDGSLAARFFLSSRAAGKTD